MTTPLVHFNGLSPARAEQLAMLAEECGEVIQVVGKILRHGHDSTHPDDPYTTNRDLLGKELDDVFAVVSLLKRGGFVFVDPTPEGQADTLKRKMRYTHHQGDSFDV